MAEKTYFEAVGRRKNAIARVRLTESAQQKIVVNEKETESYFPTDTLRAEAREALAYAGKKFSVTAKIVGGGIRGQAGALRHGIARALEKYDPELRTPLKAAGFLKRDPRAKERRKFGLKKARKAGQWNKR